MYSTEGGEVLYHTKSHVLRFLVFFSNDVDIFVCKFKVLAFYHYLFYFVVLCLLIWASFYGVKASGSQRWVDLYFINLQPSELMKVAIIICFAKFYHRTQIHTVNNFKNLIVPMVVLILPILLVVSQPDLGTSILIGLSGLVVLWLSGVNAKYFIYSSLVLFISLPFIISFLKPYQKLRILTFF